MSESMYSRESSLDKGRTQRRLANRRKRLAGAFAGVAIAGALSVGGTIAWLSAETPDVTNTFTTTTTTTGIVEDIDGLVKKNVQISNGSDIPVYIRASYTVSWVKLDKSSNAVDMRIAAAADEYKLDASALENGWVLDSATGLYYYTSPVQPGDLTSNLIDSVKPVEEKAPGDDFILSVQIVSESIQAMPTDAVEDAWKAIVVDKDGNLALASSAS